jgi:hypothetical protein
MAASSSTDVTLREELAKPEELRDQFTRRTRTVAATFDALRSEVREATDWRTQAGRHPYVLSALAGAAVLLAFRLMRPRPPHPRERVLSAMADGLEVVAGRLRSSRGRTGSAAGPSRVVQAVLAAAARRALRRRWRAVYSGFNGRHRPSV